MKRWLQKIARIDFTELLLLAPLFSPAIAQATQGREDRCITLSVMLFAMPAFFTMAAFTIYAIVKLRKHGQLPPHTGKKMLVLSAITLVVSLPLSAWCMHLAKWFAGFVWGMFIFFMPVLLLSVLNMFLAKKLRARTTNAAGSLDKKF